MQLGAHATSQNGDDRSLPRECYTYFVTEKLQEPRNEVVSACFCHAILDDNDCRSVSDDLVSAYRYLPGVVRPKIQVVGEAQKRERKGISKLRCPSTMNQNIPSSVLGIAVQPGIP